MGNGGSFLGGLEQDSENSPVCIHFYVHVLLCLWCGTYAQKQFIVAVTVEVPFKDKIE